MDTGATKNVVGEGLITLKGKEVTLRFDYKALHFLERAIGRPVPRLFHDAQTGGIGIGDLAACLQAGFLHLTQGKPVSTDKVLKMMEPGKFHEHLNTVVALLADVLAGGADDDDEEGDAAQEGEDDPLAVLQAASGSTGQQP